MRSGSSDILIGIRPANAGQVHADGPGEIVAQPVQAFAIGVIFDAAQRAQIEGQGKRLLLSQKQWAASQGMRQAENIHDMRVVIREIEKKKFAGLEAFADFAEQGIGVKESEAAEGDHAAGAQGGPDGDDVDIVEGRSLGAEIDGHVAADSAVFRGKEGVDLGTLVFRGAGHGVSEGNVNLRDGPWGRKIGGILRWGRLRYPSGMAMIWLNESFVEDEAASISPRDAGLLHAAGVFTTMRAYAGKVFRLEQHLKRLRGSCKSLAIPLPYSDEQLIKAVGELLVKNELGNARLRLTVTRGHLAGADRPGEVVPMVLLTGAELVPYPEDYYRDGMTAAVEDKQKLNPYDVQAGHKTLNYFSRLAALRTANQRGAGEAMMFDVHNYLQSGAISNVFVVREGMLLTPPTQEEMTEGMPYPRSAVLPGVTRTAVLELARAEGIEIRGAAIPIDALLGAEELFITNSIMGVMPVCRIERKGIGEEKPGPVTRRLMEAYEGEILNSEL